VSRSIYHHIRNMLLVPLSLPSPGQTFLWMADLLVHCLSGPVLEIDAYEHIMYQLCQTGWVISTFINRHRSGTHRTRK
jgi:hypothetical protein